MVGTQASIAGLNRWLEQCRNELGGKKSTKRNLFAPFPGFSRESTFDSEIILDSSLNCEILPDDITKLNVAKNFNDRVSASVNLFMPALQNAAQKKPDVLICLMPLELLTLLGEEDDDAGDDYTPAEVCSAV